MSEEEHVLVASRESLGGADLFQGVCLSGEKRSEMVRLFRRPEVFRFVPRAPAEKDPSLKQIIPYVVFQFQETLFHYRRGKGASEARLHAKRSIGVGGHINPGDSLAEFGVDPLYCLFSGMFRELVEEVELASPFRFNLVGFLNDDSDEVGSVHLGVVLRCLLLQSPHVRRREHALEGDGFESIDTLRLQRAEFESWSRILLDERCAEAFAVG